jgi:hypothetical protein
MMLKLRVITAVVVAWSPVCAEGSMWIPGKQTTRVGNEMHILF